MGSVLTDAPLPGRKAAEYTCRCGKCRACADACPGHAIKGVEWTPDRDRDDLIAFDACRLTVEERGKALGIRNGACGICVVVCPYTRKYMRAE